MASESGEIDSRELAGAGTVESRGFDGCDAVLLIGPNRPPNGDVAAMVKAATDRGAGLLVALRSQTGSPLGGVELILADAGISIRAAIALDPTANVGVPLLWATTTGYGEHPVTAPFARRGARTVWPAPAGALAHGRASHRTGHGIKKTRGPRPTLKASLLPSL